MNASLKRLLGDRGLDPRIFEKSLPANFSSIDEYMTNNGATFQSEGPVLIGSDVYWDFGDVVKDSTGVANANGSSISVFSNSSGNRKAFSPYAIYVSTGVF